MVAIFVIDVRVRFDSKRRLEKVLETRTATAPQAAAQAVSRKAGKR